jgi:hypothetical protein
LFGIKFWFERILTIHFFGLLNGCLRGICLPSKIFGNGFEDYLILHITICGIQMIFIL